MGIPRDIEDAFRDESGSLLLSRTAVSEIGERLWEDHLEFSKRDLGKHDVAYLFVDGIAERIRPGQRREPVLAAWGVTSRGRKVLLGLMAGSKEDHETVSAFLPGHEEPQPQRTSACGLGRRRRHHQGDRDLLPPF